MNNAISPVAELVERLDPDLRYLYEERAGIMEFDAEQPRDHAECLALVNVLKSNPDALSGICLVQVELNEVTEYLLTTDYELVCQRFAATTARLTRVTSSAALLDRVFSGMTLLKRLA